MKIVVNRCYGGFGISRECAEYMESRGDLQAKAELDSWRKEQAALDYFKENNKWPEDRTEESVRYLEIGIKYDNFDATFHGYGYDRTNPALIEAVEKLKEKASSKFANLQIIEIPDDVEWEIDEYDGMESIHEKHRSW